MIGVDVVVRASGVVVGATAVLDATDPATPKRLARALFWGAFATMLLVGTLLPDFVNGCLVILLAVVAGSGALDHPRGPKDQARATPSTPPPEAAARNVVFLPALLVPTLTLVGAFALRRVPFVDPKNVSLVALGLAAAIALVVALVVLRQPPSSPLHEGRRLLGLVGWAAVLPQMLAALGTLFADAGVGDRVADLVGRFVPLDHRFAAVAAYTIGMAIFTVVMGNAFAAFPVMTAAIGLPVIVKRFGGDPAVMAAIGMLSGFCGTLMTPMAANFNVVPAALLELPDKNGVIRVQVPTALAVLVANTLLMYFLVYR